MNERLKEIRKHFHVTQQEFADSLNMSKSSIESFELGRRELTDRTIADICRIFNVNEFWLRTGEGEMFKPLDREQKIAEITKVMLAEEDDSIRMKFFEIVAGLNEYELDKLKEYAKILLNQQENSPE